MLSTLLAWFLGDLMPFLISLLHNSRKKCQELNVRSWDFTCICVCAKPDIPAILSTVSDYGPLYLSLSSYTKFEKGKILKFVKCIRNWRKWYYEIQNWRSYYEIYRFSEPGYKTWRSYSRNCQTELICVSCTKLK